nr:hypothetical protein [Streptococcus sp. Marseille-Q6470]
MEKMNKSIQLLLLISLVYLGFCSCLFWPGIVLTLKQSCFYFLLLLLLLAAICTFIHYLSGHDHVRSQLHNRSRSFFLLYGSMVIINVAGASFILFKSINTDSLLQKEIVDLLLISFFFLFGLDLATFLPLNKWKKLPTHKKTGKLTTLIFFSLFFLHNPLTILSVGFYILLGASFLNFIFPKTLRQDLSFYSHIIRNILLVLSTLMFW